MKFTHHGEKLVMKAPLAEKNQGLNVRTFSCDDRNHFNRPSDMHGGFANGDFYIDG